MGVTILRELYLITSGGPFQHERHYPPKQKEEQQGKKVVVISLWRSSYFYIVDLSFGWFMKMFNINKGSFSVCGGSKRQLVNIKV